MLNSIVRFLLASPLRILVMLWRIRPYHLVSAIRALAVFCKLRSGPVKRVQENEPVLRIVQPQFPKPPETAADRVISLPVIG